VRIASSTWLDARQALGLLAVSALMACGCGPTTESAQPQTGGIITFGPHITETLFALGQGGRVAAVTSFCDYPPEVADLPKVGGPKDPDKEKITLLAPDLIIVQGKIQEVTTLAGKNGTPLLSVQMDSFSGIEEGIVSIGEALGCPQKAEALRSTFAARIDAIRKAVADRPRPKVLIITGRIVHDLNSLYTAGGQSFLSDMVDVAGGDNIYFDADEPYLEASKETVVLRGPDVIIEFHAGETLTQEEQQSFVEDWQQLPSLPAVMNGRIYLVTESYAMRPGPRVPIVTRKLASFIHPEADLPEP
jgi:iron complex transport system substrate-binding protein